MAHHTLITVSGFVATSPKLVVRGAGAAFCTFRLASTPRRFDRSAGSWIDDRTEWFTVKVFRDAAENVGQSVHKGDPLVVHGRFQTSEWTADDGTPRTSREIIAISLGHDLNFGVAHFVRAVRGRANGAEEAVVAGSSPDGTEEVPAARVVESDEGGALGGQDVAPVSDPRGDNRGELDDTGALAGNRDGAIEALAL